MPRAELGSSTGSDHEPSSIVELFVQVMYVGSGTLQSLPLASQSGGQSMLELPPEQSVQVLQTVGVRWSCTVVV